MIETAFDTITRGRRYSTGSESRVYVLPEDLSEPFGEPCVIKIYTEGATRRVYPLEGNVNGRIPSSGDVVPLEALADHEFNIGTGLRDLGLNVPTMHQTLTYGSPSEGTVHYLGGKNVPALVMGQLRGLRDFKDLHESEHPVALGSFVKSIATAMYGGYRPTEETAHDLNTLYDDNGELTFLDFTQWRECDPMDEQEVMDFLKIKRVLPKKAWEMDLVLS